MDKNEITKTMKKQLLIISTIALFFTFEVIQAQVHYQNTTTNNTNSSAIGYSTIASGEKSFASGLTSTASGVGSTTLGINNLASGNYSIALGSYLNAIQDHSIVIGSGAANSFRLENNQTYSLMIGFLSQYPTLFVGTSPSYNKTGKVGIGNITNPLYKLHIKADEGEEAAMFVEPARWESGASAGIYIGNLLHNIKAIESQGLVFNSPKNYYFLGGNVSIGHGIGEPETALDVAGTVKMSGFQLSGHEIVQPGWVLVANNINGTATWQDPSTFITGLWDKKGNDIYYNKGRVSINTEITPTASDMFLTVKGSQIIYGPNASLFFGDDENTLSGYGKYGIEHQNGGLNFWIPWEGSEGEEDRFMNYVLFLKDNGNVGIGTDEPTEKLDVNGSVLFHDNDDQYLSVGDRKLVFGSEHFNITAAFNGKIWANEIEVSTDSWSDYVFENDYLLLPINEVEDFIKVNKHLPGVPSENEVIEEGINLGEMDAVLLKKIEELTLYVIELKKELEELKQSQAK
jgi:hypothetical protein